MSAPPEAGGDAAAAGGLGGAAAPAALDGRGDRPSPAAQRLDRRPAAAPPGSGAAAGPRTPGPDSALPMGAARRAAASRRQEARTDRAGGAPHQRRSPQSGARGRGGGRGRGASLYVPAALRLQYA